MYRAMKMINKDDILLSSWDEHVLGTFSRLKLGRKIAYLQHHTANHPSCYTVDFQVITVSQYAKDYIQSTYNRRCKVLPNIIYIPETVRPLQFQSKKDVIVTANPRRDVDVYQKFKDDNQLDFPINVLQWKSRRHFLDTINSRKYYLSFYRQDGFGLPPIQAMRMGTIPIIISNSTGKDYSRPDNSFYFDVKQFMSNRITMKDIMNGSKLIDISKNGIQTAKKYMGSKILQVI